LGILKKVFVVFLLYSLTGCAIEHGRYAVIIPNELDEQKEYELKVKNAEGKATSIYWALYSEQPPVVEDAIIDALKKHNGTHMKNVRVALEWWIVPLIWGNFSMVAQGEVWGEKEQ
jgi:hypothetical protein